MATTNRTAPTRLPLLFAVALLAVSMAPPAAAGEGTLDPRQRAAVEATRDRLLAGSGAFDLARSLTADVGPRLAGSDGDRRAVEWGLAAMRRLGFANVRAEPVTVPVWIRGGASAAIVTPAAQPLAICALGGSVGTPEGGIEARVVRVASLDEVDRLPESEVRGRIVFFDQRMPRRPDGAGYGATVKIRGEGAHRAAARGAVAVLIRSVGTSSNRLPHTGGMKMNPPPTIPAAALSNPDADLLAEQFQRGRKVIVRMELGCRTAGEAESANVVGEIVGRDRPDEIILMGAHLDSWDLGTGALDDAAGCAVALAALRAIADSEVAPSRTIRVVLFANEEFGLSGGFDYARRHDAEIPNHLLALEADFGAGCVREFSTRIGGEGLPVAEDLLELLAPLGIGRGGVRASGGADLIPLRRAGVPVASLDQDASVYFDHHHSANDTLDKIVPEELDQVTAAFATVLQAASLVPGDFGRGPGID